MRHLMGGLVVGVLGALVLLDHQEIGRLRRRVQALGVVDSVISEAAGSDPARLRSVN